jgi:hypothetical protein
MNNSSDERLKKIFNNKTEFLLMDLNQLEIGITDTEKAGLLGKTVIKKNQLSNIIVI